MQLFHRTSIPAARAIVQHGFEDESWGFGSDDRTGRALTMQGVWLSDRPVSPEEGPPGAAVLEVELNLPEATLGAFEIRGVFDDARIWVIPADLVNRNSSIRIGG